MKPIIAITPATDGVKFTLNQAYCKAVTAAGGIPIILPYIDPAKCQTDMRQTLTHVDGLILSGGGDIHAKYFNETLHPKADFIFCDRDAYELTLCDMALALDMPMLCICRGVQILNVAVGGGIHQHIEGHNYDDKRTETVHGVTIKNGTLLHSLLNKNELPVNSIHHQAIARLGNSAVASATSDDGVIEAIEISNKTFVLGVQWHPEALYLTHPENLVLFQRLIAVASL